jgi:hypothetical protein
VIRHCQGEPGSVPRFRDREERRELHSKKKGGYAMARRIWFEIWAQKQYDGENMVLLAKVKSIGLANLTKKYYENHYKKVEIR